MQVREIINLKGGTLYTASPQQALAAAIDTMAELDVGSLVVMEAGKMVGMLTFREVLQAMKQHDACPVGVTVGEVSAPRKSRVGSDVSRAVAMA